MAERATLQELLDFANKVREAGGGNPISALMPAVPEDETQCLIAKNLNFNCVVDGGLSDRDELVEGRKQNVDEWMMTVDDKDVRDRIATALGLDSVDYTEWDSDKVQYGIILPPEISQIAVDFDRWHYAVDFEYPDDHSHEGTPVLDKTATKQDIQNLKDFWPYIEESVKEDYENATFVNERGEIVI
jgi:hypothetical protein